MAKAVQLGPVGAVPDGDMKAFDAEGVQVTVANVSGALHAFNDVCTHKHCPLSKGELEGSTVTCPCHGSQFDVTTGAVIQGPAQDPVDTYPVRMEGDTLIAEI
ncbi:MAG: Rieske (2Fe-2S) protein [Actinomycetota bacterium]